MTSLIQGDAAALSQRLGAPSRVALRGWDRGEYAEVCHGQYRLGLGNEHGVVIPPDEDACSTTTHHAEAATRRSTATPRSIDRMSWEPARSGPTRQVKPTKPASTGSPRRRCDRPHIAEAQTRFDQYARQYPELTLIVKRGNRGPTLHPNG